MIKDNEKELIAFTKLWDEAIVGNDAGKIGKFMSDDWVIVGSDGIVTKASFLEWVSTGILTHSRMDADEMKVTIYGNTGIIIARVPAPEHIMEKISAYMNGQHLCL